MPFVAFGNYEVSAFQILMGLSVYLVLSALALIIIPYLAVARPEKDETLATTEKIIELRAKIRQTVMQFVGGAAVISTVIVAVQQIRQNEDSFKEKKADLFAKSLATLLDGDKKLNSRAEAMYLLAYVSRSDPSYHRSVFEALSNQIVSLSQPACQNVFTKGSKFFKDPQIQIATRILGERNPAHDPTGKRFNIERACLAELDMRDEKGVVLGLRKSRMSNANMLRSDFTNIDLSGAEMRGIDASDYLNLDWTPETGFQLHRGEQGDKRGEVEFANGYVRRLFVTHFINADLGDVNFEDSQLAGADFSGARLKGARFANANISRANFNGAQDLSADQLKAACVGRSSMTQTELEQQQPYLWKELRDQIGKDGIKACV